MQDLLSQCEQMPPNVGFAVFQEQLDQSAHAKTYAVLRERLMSTELSYEYAQEDFFGMLKKLELQSYKEEMTAIAQRMAEGKALPGDPEKYRELMAKLK
jgi:DNA primase